MLPRCQNTPARFMCPEVCDFGVWPGLFSFPSGEVARCDSWAGSPRLSLHQGRIAAFNWAKMSKDGKGLAHQTEGRLLRPGCTLPSQVVLRGVA